MRRYRLKKRLYMEDVRTMCIRNELYTRGDNSAYSDMLDMCEYGTITTRNIYKIAEDIKYHSDTTKTVDDIAYMLMQKVVLVIVDTTNS